MPWSQETSSAPWVIPADMRNRRCISRCGAAGQPSTRSSGSPGSEVQVKVLAPANPDDSEHGSTRNWRFFMQTALALGDAPHPISATSLDPYGQLIKMM